MKFSARALHRLALHVLDGDVVFFIGTGFSIDSEWNTADRLMKRLLIRLKAMCETLGPEGKEVATGFVQTFGLKANDPEPFCYTKADVDRLSDKYYEANDWFCRGFGRLLGLLEMKPEAERDVLWQKIAQREEEIRRTGGANRTALDQVAFDELPVALLDWIQRSGEQMPRLAGKALFLDTMGFRHPGIMGGDPTQTLADETADSYEDRLLPRHHVLARFAREGFCNSTLTTNYDLLLEGAFRVAGFGYDGCEPLAPPSYFDNFARISSPAEFFTKGKALRTATVVKMHGCAERYRNIRPQDHGRLTRYLRSMVFTYREIQNWREDSWAADYLRTLLRTRTVVFSGYSLRDPVIHDTFRTVYEEMTREKPASDDPASPPGTLAQAPAFFLGSVQDANEFYGMEVLRAAGTAVGAGSHPLAASSNYIRFYFRSKPEFPHLDEVFRWLFHSVYRRRQLECLNADLESIVVLLLGRRRPDAELEAVRRRFRKIWAHELRSSRGWDDQADRRGPSRQEHAAICGWTDGFGTALLREFACTDQVHRWRGPNRQLTLMRLLPWHCPSTHNSGWTCWGAVVELALRRMLARFSEEPDQAADGHGVRGAESLQPTVLFPAKRDALPDAVTICFRGFEALARNPRLWAKVRRRVFWELKPGDTPWPLAPRGTETLEAVAAPATARTRGSSGCDAPHAGIIWRWAAGTETAQDQRNLRCFFGAEVNDS